MRRPRTVISSRPSESFIRQNISIICSFFSLGIVIDALITTRFLIQFIGQIFAIALLRKRAPGMKRPYRMWLYPLHSIVALIGWVFIFATTDRPIILLGLVTLLLGVIFFLIWSWYTERWPFAMPAQKPAD